MTVMVVEDDHALRDNLSELLEDEGYRPICAQNGREALHYLRSQKVLPDVILLDLEMPIMTGWQFRQHQLEDARLSSVPVIVVSATDDCTLPAQARISKPFASEQLLAAIGRLLRGG